MKKTKTINLSQIYYIMITDGVYSLAYTKSDTDPTEFIESHYIDPSELAPGKKLCSQCGAVYDASLGKCPDEDCEPIVVNIHDIPNLIYEMLLSGNKVIINNTTTFSL